MAEGFASLMPMFNNMHLLTYMVFVHLQVNPFEVKINKQKHKVVGQKISKHDKGRPGVSRARAMQKVKLIVMKLLR